MGKIVQRILGSLGVHLVLGGIALALVYYLTSHLEDASETLRGSVDGTEDAQTSIMTYLASAQQDLMQWTLFCFGFGWLLSCLFLLLANRDNPASENQGARKLGVWAGLLFILIAYVGLIWWRQLSMPDVAASIMFGNYATALAVGIVATLLAFWLGSALFVKKSMKPSVPLAVTLRGME